MRPPVAGPAADHPAGLRETVLGEFCGLARWAAGPYATAASRRGFFHQSLPVGTADGGESLPGANETLDAVLAAIDSEIDWRTAAIRHGLEAEFAARVAHARKHLSPALLVATIAAVKQQREAALAWLNRNAAIEKAGRKKAAIEQSTPIRPHNNKREGLSGPSGSQAPRS